MNLYLHEIEPKIYLGDTIYEPKKNDLYDCILTNPPFGTKGANQAPERDDFTIETDQFRLKQVLKNVEKENDHCTAPDHGRFSSRHTG